MIYLLLSHVLFNGIAGLLQSIQQVEWSPVIVQHLILIKEIGHVIGSILLIWSQKNNQGLTLGQL